MSARIVKSFSKRTGRTVQEIDELWVLAKGFALEHHDPHDPEYFTEAICKLKGLLGLKEEYQFLDKFKKLLS